MEQETFDRLELKAKFFRGFGNVIKLAILESLIDGEKSVGEIVELVECKQSRISNQLACLRDCDLVRTRREGRRVFYSIKDAQVIEMLRMADAILARHAEQVYSCTRM